MDPTAGGRKTVRTCRLVAACRRGSDGARRPAAAGLRQFARDADHASPLVVSRSLQPKKGRRADDEAPVKQLCTALLALFAGAAVPALAAADRAEGAFDAGEPRLAARLVLDPDATAPGRARAGVHFTLDPGWHLYWKNPGDTGLATKLAWQGGRVFATTWPAPSAFSEGEGTLVTYGYAGEVLIASELELDAGARTLGVAADVLVCKTSCIPAKLALERELAAPASRAEASALRALFAAHDAALPRAPGALGFALTARLVDARRPERIALALRTCPADAPSSACASVAPPRSGPVFFSEDPALRVASAEAAPAGLALVLERAEGAAPRLRGVLALGASDGRVHHLAVDLALPDAPARSAAGGLLAALALGVLGGLLLNLMPCVLPVLAIKAFAVVELAGSGRRGALAHGAAYAGGILASMLALAGVVLALRAAGSEVGWGFQFQSPGFLVAVSALCVTFALNLFGVFEIGFVPGGLASVGADAPGARRSFFEGLLAVALATPCSAPFLGTAVGFAFASGGALVVAIFLAIGLGLAAPFLLISAFPPAARWLPRSGAWMGELRSLLGFALLATVVWLAWLTGRSAGADAVAALLALLLAVAFVGWLYGRLERRGLRGLVIVAGVALVATAPNWISFEPAGAGAARPGELAWRAGEVERLRAEGRPILVVFTADWCLTCKVNEKTVLEAEAVRAALARGGWAVLTADWTRRDEAIRAELARFGRAGVPLYLVYRPGAAGPQVLPELLSVEGLLGALEIREPDHARPTRAADAS
jgi:thiol:disulfide interchange protein DsbD